MTRSVPTISIALATFDGASFLRPQLASYLDQTSPPDELVVGDDGSSDDTVAILTEFAARAPFPVRIERNVRRLGFSANFLTIAHRCTSDVVAFSDQDNVWRPDKLARCGAVMARGTVALVQHQARIIGPDGRTRGGSFPDRGPSRIAPPGTMDPWTPGFGLTMVARRDLVDIAVRLVPTPSWDLDGTRMDFDEWIAFLARGLFDSAIVAEDLADYREHPRNVMGPPSGGAFDRVLARLRFGSADYGRHAALYADLQQFWLTTAADPSLPADRCEAAAARFAMLCAAARAAATARDPRANRVIQLWRMALLATKGTYARRAAGGLGSLAFGRDVLAAAAGLDGVSEGSPVPTEVLDRILEERTAGASFDAIAGGLHRSGIPSPRAGGWRAATIRDLAYLRRSQLDPTRHAPARPTAGSESR